MTLPQNLHIQQPNFLGSVVAYFFAGSTCFVKVEMVIRKEYGDLENRAEARSRRFIDPEVQEKRKIYLDSMVLKKEIWIVKESHIKDLYLKV